MVHSFGVAMPKTRPTSILGVAIFHFIFGGRGRGSRRSEQDARRDGSIHATKEPALQSSAVRQHGSHRGSFLVHGNHWSRPAPDGIVGPNTVHHLWSAEHRAFTLGIPGLHL